MHIHIPSARLHMQISKTCSMPLHPEVRRLFQDRRIPLGDKQERFLDAFGAEYVEDLKLLSKQDWADLLDGGKVGAQRRGELLRKHLSKEKFDASKNAPLPLSPDSSPPPTVAA